MLFAAVPPTPVPPIFDRLKATVSQVASPERSRLGCEAGPLDSWNESVSQSDLKAFEVDVRRYPLRGPVTGHFFPDSSEFVAPAIPGVSGRGATFAAAFEDWKTNFDRHFQRLRSMRPFEMVEADKAEWARLRRIVNVAQHLAQTPIVTRQIGRLVRWRGKGDDAIVRWETGRGERVAPSKLPTDFADTIKHGQAFEAKVARSRTDYSIIRISEVVALSERDADSRTPSEIAAGFGSINERPVFEWD